MGVLRTILGIICLCTLYLIPTAIALFRGRTNTFAIFLMNFFLGWALIGWILALIWAVSHDGSRDQRENARRSG